LLTTAICLLSEAKQRKRRSCWASNWITRRPQHNIGNTWSVVWGWSRV